MKKLSFLKILQDRIYAIENMCRFFKPDSCGLVSFKLFQKQKEIINTIENNKRVIVYNGRQTGCSSTILSNLVIESILIPNKVIMVVCKKYSLCHLKHDFIIDCINSSLITLDEDESFIIKNTKNQIILGNGSIINFVNDSVDSFRGYNPDIIFYDNITMDYNLFTQSISPFSNSKIILTFNPFDHLSEYKNISELGFKIIKCKWYDDPRFNTDLAWVTENGDHVYDETKFTKESYKIALSLGLKPTSTWYREMSKCLGNDSEKIRVELDCEFE